MSTHDLSGGASTDDQDSGVPLITETQREYVIWQNRAFRFYLAARVLYKARIYGPAALCANQAIELLLKATLIYHDRSFKPDAANHRVAGMLRTIGNKVKPKRAISVPRYFYADRRYQSVSRYPQHGLGLMVPGSFLPDLDRSFRELVVLVPFQHNTELRRHLTSSDRTVRLQLTSRNAETAALRRFLGIRPGAR